MTESEREEMQMRQMKMLGRVVTMMAFRRRRLFVIVFLASAAVLTTALMFLSARSLSRCEVVTRLQYYPKVSKHATAMDEMQMFQFLTRETLFKAYVGKLRLTGAELARAKEDITITQDRRNRRLFTITALAATEARARTKANGFADLCIESYRNGRREELENLVATCHARRKEMLEQMVSIDAEDRELARTHGIPSSEIDSTTLRNTIAERKLQLSSLEAKLHSSELRIRYLREDLHGMSPAAFDHVKDLRELQQELKACENEIEQLRERYTEKNPRMVVVIAKRTRVREKINNFLRDQNLPEMGADALERFANIGDRLREAQLEYDTMVSNRGILTNEIAVSERNLALLDDLGPQFESNRHQRESLRAAVHGQEEIISDIRYQQAALEGDLSQVERALNGNMESLFARKTVAFGIVGGLFLALVAFSVILALDYLMGCVLGAREVANYAGLRSLGAVLKCPPAGENATSRDDYDHVCYQLNENLSNGELKDGDTGVVAFYGRLAGGDFDDGLWTAWGNQVMMTGRRMVVVDLLQADTFVAPESAQALSAVWVRDGQAWCPVKKRKALSLVECNLLRHDLGVLRERFDIVVVRCQTEVGVNAFLRQMAKLADALVLCVSAGKTRRRQLRELVAFGRRTGVEPMVVTTGALSTQELTEEA